jgi:hypothetical protein
LFKTAVKAKKPLTGLLWFKASSADFISFYKTIAIKINTLDGD